VVRAGIREAREPELTDPPEALYLSRVEQAGNNRVLVGLE